MNNNMLFDDELENLYYEDESVLFSFDCVNNYDKCDEEETEIEEELEPKLVEANETIPEKNKNYWTEETENNIKKYILNNYLHYTYKLIKYIKEINQKTENINIDYIIYLSKKIENLKKDEIIKSNNEFFKQKIYPSLYTLAKNILYTYNLFQKTITIEEQIKECINYVFQKIILFDPSLNKKSFSYLGTIAKRFYIKELEDEYINYIVSTKINDNDDTVHKNISAKEKKLIKQKNEYDDKYYIEINEQYSAKIYNQDLYYKETIEKMIQYVINNLSEYALTCENDITKKIIEQVIYLLSNTETQKIDLRRKEIIKILSKKTNLPTSVIKQEIKKIKEVYVKIKEDFNQLI